MGKLIFYGVVGFLAWNAKGPITAAIVVFVIASIHLWIVKGDMSLEPTQVSDQKSERKGLNAVGKFFGAVLGWIWIGSIGFGLLAAILSPGSCSQGGGSQEYRAR